MTIDILGAKRDQLGECPVWDDRTASLFHTDVEGRALHRYHPGTGLHEVRATSGRPGSFALTDDPDVLVVAMEHSIQLMHWSTGSLVPWVDIEPSDLPNRLNDGRCDRTGSFWVGSMHEDGALPTGMLHRVAQDGSAAVFVTDVTIANGLAFSPDGARMYFADSPRRTVWSFDIIDGVADPSTRSVLTDFGDLPGFPDGACIDADGCYWTACVYGSAIARLTPDGRVDTIIEVPVGAPTMPAFGGTDLTTIYVTSIGEGSFAARGGPTELDGALIAIESAFVGLAEPRFPCQARRTEIRITPPR